ncbi:MULTISPECIES: LysR family transcriptional regulator [unclassified Rhizobium]|uniref:LysR family transcriptional regulator n=1 Tax=unclassified Rhizobium TaxID=2613769 RepID=UPI0007EBEBA4|nr:MULTISPECIES: LysR family transcriptional regulator [unclassified Rhizobium]ANM14486.1 LysR family transcriptional regulator protein [Rhizobium sp. N324]OYC99588.1 LysR family transcriptional regulator protein [Rhizobium sp. N4311]
MIDLRTLETFCIVAQTGGFHRAAEKLHTTQPAVSARIAQLEQELKVRLFERDKRGSRLTAKGREILKYAERMLALRTEMVLSVAGANALEGSVQLGVSDTIVHTWLPELLKRLNHEYPSITLEINVDGSANLAAALQENSIDVAFLMGPVISGNVANLPLCEYPLNWVVPADFPLGPQAVTLEELTAFPIITFARQTQPFRELTELFNKAHQQRVRLFPNSSLSSIVRMTLDGIGIAAIPVEVVSDHLASGKLRVLTTVGHTMPTMAFTASFIKRPETHLNGVVAQLAQKVAGHYALVPGGLPAEDHPIGTD